MIDKKKKQSLADDLLSDVSGGLIMAKNQVSESSDLSDRCPICGLPKSGAGKNICTCKTAVI